LKDPQSLLILCWERNFSSPALPSLQVGPWRNAAYSADFLMGIMAIKYANNISHNKLPGVMEATLRLCVKPESDQHLPPRDDPPCCPQGRCCSMHGAGMCWC